MPFVCATPVSTAVRDNPPLTAVLTHTGYGWFLALVTVLVLPSPILYFYYKDTRSLPAESDEGFQENPLSQSGQSNTYDVELPNAQRLQLAKMQRESKNMRAQTKKTQNQLLRHLLNQILKHLHSPIHSKQL